MILVGERDRGRVLRDRVRVGSAVALHARHRRGDVLVRRRIPDTPARHGVRF